MKKRFTLLVIVLIASVICFRVTADSEDNAADTKTSGSNDKVNETAHPVKKDESSNLDKNDPKEKLESKGGENERNKDEVKENEGSEKEASGTSELTITEKCDSSSNRCMNDDKTLVACLRVPGNESPALSLLIQNRGKGSLSIKISAPDLVQLEKNHIELEEKKDTEVKVSISGIESSYIIILTAGQGGNCSLNIRDQFVGRNEIDHSNESPKPNIFILTLSTTFLFVAAVLIVVLSVFTCTKLGIKYFPRKVPKYQKLDMDLPLSHGSRVEQGENEGWDDSWGDSWDDEEAPKTPSLPVTPSLSSKGIASRKFSKDSWKD